MSVSSQTPAVRSAAELSKLYAVANDAFEASKSRLDACEAAYKQATRFIARCEKAKATRAWLDKGITRLGTYINLIVAAVSVTVIAASWSGLSVPWVVMTSLAAGAAAARATLWLIHPSDAEMERLKVRKEAAKLAASSEIANLSPQTEGLHRRARALKRELEDARKRESCIKKQLLACGWEGMTGVEFETFLQRVLESLGFGVRTTKTTGDQGVDLVVSCPARKIAVQAKGYPNSTVGNSAVQEAFTGMTYYGCDVAVVITNSTFTSAAKDVASKVGCVLIDRWRIPALVDGTIFTPASVAAAQP